NVMIFEQINEQANRKCSLCGERNAYFFHSNSKPSFAYGDSYKINSPKIIRNEGLCAICCIKRFLNFNTKGKNNSFESTAEIALMDTINKIKDKSILQNYLDNFEEKDQDFQLYYKDNIDTRYLKKNNISCPKKLDEIQNELNEIYTQATKLKLKFTKYYAVLAFDGDNIGKILSGIYKKDEKTLLDFHKKLSEYLNNFATKSKEVVENKSRGRVVYAGGDDFLGFININHIFDVMEELRKEFDNIVVTGIKDFLKEGNENNITFSAGVVIAHYKMPLDQIVAISNSLVSEAKDSYNNKDSFAISVMKNSGEINKAYFKWKIIDNENKTIFTTNIMKKLTIHLAKGEISNNFIKILNKEFFNFEIDNFEISDIEQKNSLFICELKRCIKKSSFNKKYEELEEQLSNLFINIIKNLNSNEKNGFNNFLSLLNIADFISREINND
ncbi:MAG: type III-B CRISPR-associated protein Cas10/Cmr2, partial [Cyanobacteriota bacterium]